MLFKGQLPGSTRESESSAPFTPPPAVALGAGGVGWGPQVQVGIFQSPSPQAELQSAEPGMQPMQPVQGACRSSECPRAAPSAVSGRGRAQGVGDVVTTARRGDCERSAGSSVGSVGSGFTEWQGEKAAATLASMLRLLEPPAPIS